MRSQQGLTDALGEAVADVRQKLVEEGWFGRAVTPAPVEATNSMAEALGWRKEERDADHHRNRSSDVPAEKGLTYALSDAQQNIESATPETPSVLGVEYER